MTNPFKKYKYGDYSPASILFFALFPRKRDWYIAQPYVRRLIIRNALGINKHGKKRG